MTERTLRYPEDKKELDNLSMAAKIMTALACDNNIEYVVQDCYFDYGQDWMWTTILKINHNEVGILRSCQFINPRQWKEIISIESKEEMLEYMKNFI